MKVKQRNILTPTFNVDNEAMGRRSAPVSAQLLDGCERALAYVRFDATALPVHAIEHVAGYDGVMLNVRIVAPDRDGSEKVMEITRSIIRPWHVIEFNGPDYLVRWTLETICGIVVHEVCENFRFDGKLVIDNHGALR